MVYLVLVIVWLSAGFYCGQVAHQKGYSGTAWAIGGFFFGFIALIAAAGLPDRKLRKYIRLIGEKQNAIEVVKETGETGETGETDETDETVEVVDGNTKISFAMPKDSSKEEIYKELVLVLKEGGCKLEKYNVTSYDLNMVNWGKEFIVNSEEKDCLIILDGKEKGNIINWSGRI